MSKLASKADSCEKTVSCMRFKIASTGEHRNAGKFENNFFRNMTLVSVENGVILNK